MERELFINIEDILKFKKTGFFNVSAYQNQQSGSEIVVLSYAVGRFRVMYFDVHFYTGSLSKTEANAELAKLIESGTVNRLMRKIADRQFSRTAVKSVNG